MSTPSTEESFLGRFLLGFAVIAAMFAGGGAVGWTLREAGVPYGDWVGAGLGALAVFVAFAVLYSRYTASGVAE
jgi:hypothetical protein